MEPVGARTARAIAPIVAPEGPRVAISRPAAATIWSSSNFAARGTGKRIYVLIQPVKPSGGGRCGYYVHSPAACVWRSFGGLIAAPLRGPGCAFLCCCYDTCRHLGTL